MDDGETDLGSPADLEVEGWRALSGDGATAGTFYRRVLDESVVMLLPGGLRLTDRDETVAAMSGTPWTDHRLEDLSTAHPTPDTGLVTYGVVARRDGAPEYSALVSSLYVRRSGGWRMAFHQQTPR